MLEHGASGRPLIDLDESKDAILDLHYRGVKYNRIAAQYSTLESTIKRRLRKWGV